VKRLLRIAMPICVLLGVVLLATTGLAAPSSAATSSSRTAATTSPATCNPERVHTSKYAGASVGGRDFVRCAVALKPPHSGSASAAASDPGTADDKFDFCNTTGGIIACFNAMLHFDSSTEFTLYDIELSDDLNDGRSVYADVDTQAVDFGYFSNTGGQGTEYYDSSGYDFTDSFDGVQDVYIDLYACGSIFSGCSSDTYSTVQSNPDFTASASAAVSTPASASLTRANPGTVTAPKASWKVWSMTTAERNQVGLDAEASKIHQLISADHLTGYAGLVVHPSSDNLTVYWSGQTPAALKDYARSRAHAGPIQLSPARYSLADLQALSMKIVKSPGFQQAGIVMLKPAADGSGLQLGVSGSRAKAQALSAVKSDPSAVSYTKAASRQDAGRWADIPSFFGGALIYSLGDGADCSSGWPVHATSSSSTYYLITAGHCTHIPEKNLSQNQFVTAPYTGVPVKPIGTASAEDLTLDAGLIDTGTNGSPLGGNGNAIYTGQVDPTGVGTFEMTAGVDGFVDNNVGDDDVCTSGSYSGEICGLDITSTNVMWPVNYGDVEAVVTGIEVTNPNGTNAAGEGDSGGPIYSYVNAGLVAARGIISTGDPDSPAPCTGVLYRANNPDNPPRQCTSVIWGPDIEEILNSPFMPTTALNDEP
jgi:hypothetical protein